MHINQKRAFDLPLLNSSLFHSPFSCCFCAYIILRCLYDYWALALILDLFYHNIIQLSNIQCYTRYMMYIYLQHYFAIDSSIPFSFCHTI